MKPVNKIRDFPRVTTVQNEHYVLVRKENNLWVWHGGRLDDIIAYKRTPVSTNKKVPIKDMSSRLIHHLEDDFPHTLEHKGHGVDKYYRLWKCSIGFLEIQMIDLGDKPSYQYDSSQQILDFIPMFLKHTKENGRFHIMYDYGSASWYWYDFKFAEEEIGGETFDFLDLHLYNSSVNPEIPGDEEEFEYDYNLMNSYLDLHKEDSAPHRVHQGEETEDEKQFSLVMDGGEIEVKLEDLHEYIRV